MERLLRTLAALGGSASRAQLIDAGISGPMLTAAVRRGFIFRVRRGHYASPDASVAQLAAVRVGGRLGCLSATRSYGLWGGSDDAVHVSIARNAARLRLSTDDSGARTSDRFRVPVRLHWHDLPVGRRSDDSTWRRSLPRALSEVARCASRADVRAAYESAVHAGMLDLETAQRILDSSVPEVFGPMRLSALSESGAESHAVELLDRVGASYVQQVPFGDERSDFVVDGRFVFEVDGRRYHETREAMEKDRDRDAARLALGFPTLRILAKTITDRPEHALRVIQGVRAGLSR